MRKSNRLPTQFPAGSKYVLEARGVLVYRHVELPGGRRVALPPRQALTCVCATSPEISLVPGLSADAEPARKAAAPRRRRARERA